MTNTGRHLVLRDALVCSFARGMIPGGADEYHKDGTYLNRALSKTDSQLASEAATTLPRSFVQRKPQGKIHRKLKIGSAPRESYPQAQIDGPTRRVDVRRSHLKDSRRQVCSRQGVAVQRSGARKPLVEREAERRLGIHRKRCPNLKTDCVSRFNVAPRESIGACRIGCLKMFCRREIRGIGKAPEIHQGIARLHHRQAPLQTLKTRSQRHFG